MPRKMASPGKVKWIRTNGSDVCSKRNGEITFSFDVLYEVMFSKAS